MAGICLRSGNSFLVAGATLDGRPHEIAPLTYCHPSSVTDTLESSLVPRRSLLLAFLKGFLLESYGKLKMTLDRLAKNKSPTCTI